MPLFKAKVLKTGDVQNTTPVNRLHLGKKIGEALSPYQLCKSSHA